MHRARATVYILAVNISRLKCVKMSSENSKKGIEWKVIRQSVASRHRCRRANERDLERDENMQKVNITHETNEFRRIQLLNHCNVMKMNIIVGYWFVELHDFLTLNWNMRCCDEIFEWCSAFFLAFSLFFRLSLFWFLAAQQFDVKLRNENRVKCTRTSFEQMFTFQLIIIGPIIESSNYKLNLHFLEKSYDFNYIIK